MAFRVSLLQAIGLTKVRQQKSLTNFPVGKITTPCLRVPPQLGAGRGTLNNIKKRALPGSDRVHGQQMVGPPLAKRSGQTKLYLAKDIGFPETILNRS